MSRRLINFTTNRDGNDDFKLWGLDPTDEGDTVSEFSSGVSDDRILVIRGSGLAPPEYDAENDVDTYRASLDPFASEISDFVTDADEIGLLYHPPKDVPGHNESIDRVLGQKKEVLAFVEYYGTSKKVPYETYYRPLAEAEADDQGAETWQEKFNALWAYCEGDLVLEAKLILLHELLVPPPDTSVLEKEAGEDGEDGAWFTFRQHVENDTGESEEDLKRYEEAWKKNFADANVERYRDDPPGSGYYDEEGPLTKLRDKLLGATS